MKANHTIYIDLFSILATGIFVVWNLVTGADHQRPSNVDYVIVRLYISRSVELRGVTGNASLEAIMEIEPYFIRDSQEVRGSDVAAQIAVVRQFDGLVVMLQQPKDQISVGFRVKAIRDLRAIGTSGELRLVTIGAQHDEQNQVYTIGRWVDPMARIAR